MKTNIHSDIALTKRMARKGRKTKSHSTYRAKRKPNSPRVR